MLTDRFISSKGFRKYTNMTIYLYLLRSPILAEIVPKLKLSAVLSDPKILFDFAKTAPGFMNQTTKKATTDDVQFFS